MSVSAHSAIVADGSSADLEIGKPGWTLIFRTNATEVQLPSERERMIVLPRRSDLIFSMLAETVTDELELSFSIRGLDVHPTAVARAIECFDLSDYWNVTPTACPGGKRHGWRWRWRCWPTRPS